MVSRILVVALLLALMITGTGCYIPAIGGKQPSQEALLSIAPGVTTRADILHRFGPPNVLESKSYFVYQMEKGPGHFLVILGYGGAAIPTGKTKVNRLIFEFDSASILRRWHLERAAGYLLGYSDQMSPIAKTKGDSLGQDSTVSAPTVQSLPDSARIIKGPDWFAAVALSPSGAAIAAADTKGKLWLRNQSTGATATIVEPQVYDPLSREAPRILFNKSGERLLVLAKGVQVVDPASSAHIEIPEGLSKNDLKDQREAKAIAITEDGTTLARGDNKGWVRVGGRTQKTGFQSFRAHKGEVLSLAFSRDGALLATVGADRHVRIWKAGSWELVAELVREARAVCFFPDGSSLVVLCGTHVEICPVSTLLAQGVRATTYASSGPSHAFLLPYDSDDDPVSDKPWPRRASLAFSPDARFLAAATGSAVIYDTVQDKVVWRYWPHSSNRDDAIADIALLQDGNRVAVATKKGIFVIIGTWEAARAPAR